MKNIFFLIVFIMFGCVCNNQMKYNNLYSSQTKERISFKEMSKKLLQYDVIFVGEYHGNPQSHKLELDIAKFLGDNCNVAFSFEMFERDNQKSLNKYLRDEITEKQMREKVRLWSNYDSDYRNLIEFAKDKKIDVIAANIPRYLAKKVSMSGRKIIEDFTAEEISFSVEKLDFFSNEYKNKFEKIMMENSKMNKMHFKPEMLDNFFFAQTIKDQTMAESISRYIKNNKDKKVIHFNGDFHSNSFLGTIEHLKKINPELKIAVISPTYKNDIIWDSGTFVYKIKEKYDK